MKVIDLRYHDQPRRFQSLLDFFFSKGHHIKRESEEVLAIGMASDGTICSLVSPPGSELDLRIQITDPNTDIDEEFVDGKKVGD